jgi:hypothetical protein
MSTAFKRILPRHFFHPDSKVWNSIKALSVKHPSSVPAANKRSPTTAHPNGHPIYETLKLDASSLEIRLITIEYSEDISAPVRCTLRKAKLSDGYHYSALSYVWGDAVDKRAIYINDI